MTSWMQSKGSLFLVAIALNLLGASIAAERPNIVFVLADDLGWDDVSFHGSPQIPTPNLDALAADGIILNNYYVLPLCTPSRAALLTGLYPIRLGLQHRVIEPAEPRGLPLNVTLMPQYLKGLGYATHLVGKWHLGYFRRSYVPVHRGFETFYGLHGPSSDYYNKTYTIRNHSGYDFWEGEEPCLGDLGKYATERFTERAISIIHRHNKTKPLFLLLSHQAPHSSTAPNELELAPEEYNRNFTYIGETNRTIFAGMVAAMDMSTGRVFHALHEAGMLNNTIFVFSSDNGGLPWGFKSNRGFNWPLRGTKFTLWEGGVRAAAFVWSPLLNSTKRVSNQLMHITDWLPTLYTAAGGNVSNLGKIDGKDMWDALSLGEASPRTEVLLNIDPIMNNSALRVGDMKLILGTFNKSLYDQRFKTTGNRSDKIDLDRLMDNSLTSEVLKLFYQAETLNFSDGWRSRAQLNCGTNKTCDNVVPNQEFYLFNITEDPCELNDLSSSFPDVLEEMLEKLEVYARQQKKPSNMARDPQAYPEHHNGIWYYWEPNVTRSRFNETVIHAASRWFLQRS